jgi:SPX domain protein involved in polyphosphate accumulation
MCPAADNIDYTELKHLIKANTTRGQGEAVAEPGQPADEAFQRFEDDFAQELFNQHERVDLFVKSKADEFDRRLREYCHCMDCRLYELYTTDTA